MDVLPIREYRHYHYQQFVPRAEAWDAVKYLPPWFPGASFKRQAIEWEQAVSDTYDLPWKDVKTALVRILPAYILVARVDN